MSRQIRWSFSRIDKYARCPRAYKLNYIDRKRGKGNDNMRFGTWLHTVLERMHKQALADEHVGKWDDAAVLEIARQSYGKSGLGGVEHFHSGLEILNKWIEVHPTVDCYSVLAVEASFEIEIAGHRVMGYIDRIDRLPDNRVRVVDYKSNRILYQQDELDSHLQLSIYAMAAKHMFPWAQDVELEFDMLRHGCVQQTRRSYEDLEVAKQYVQAMVEAAMSDKEFEPKLHRLCAWCDHRQSCYAYQRALSDGGIEGQDAGCANIDEIAAERERVAVIAKLADDRKKEIDAALKTQIAMEGDFDAAGHHYEMRTRTTQSYPVTETVEAIAEFSPMDADDVRDAITVIKNEKINNLIKKLRDELPSSQVAMLRSQLLTVAKKRRTQFLSSSKADK